MEKMHCILYFLVINAMFHRTIGIVVYMNGNITAVVGTNVTKLECLFTRENVQFISHVAIQTKNETTNKFETIALFQNGKSTLQHGGIFLSGREFFTYINGTPTKAVLGILGLQCSDQREYRCKVEYARTGDALYANETSESLFITVRASPSKPNGIELFTEGNTKRDAHQSPEEGENIIFTCSGNVGSQNGTFIWTIRFATGREEMFHSISTLTKPEVGKCQYFGISNFSIILSAEHNNATVQCVEQSLVSFENMYEETQQIIVLYHVRNTIIQKHPDKIAYEKGTAEINLRCVSDGNPKPTFTWRKDNEVLGNDSEYTISNITTNTSGLYICISKNAINGNVFVQNATVNIMVLANGDQVELTEKPISDGDDSNKGFVSAIVGAVVGCIVIIVIAASVVVYFIFKRKHNEKSNDAGNERQTRRTISSDNYDSVDTEHGKDMRQRRPTSNAENDKTGLKYQIEAEQNDTSRRPNPKVEYAVVNKAAKKRNNGENKQSKLYEHHYASSKEGVYDTSGNPHKPEKFCEEFDRASDCKWEKKETLEDHYATSSEGVYDVSRNPRHKPTEEKEKFDEISKEITE